MRIRIHALFTLIIFCSPAFPQTKNFTTADIFSSSKFRDEALSGAHWSKNGDGIYHYKVDSAAGVTNFFKYNVANGDQKVVATVTAILRNHPREIKKFEHHIWSPDERRILFTGTLPARRPKTGGNFSIFDLETKQLRALTSNNNAQASVQFSPDGKSIAFVRDNNLMLMELESGEERQLTSDGQPHLLNGLFDWVYEEEFSIIEAWQWSPDGAYIAYWQTDERPLPRFDIALYDSLHLNWNRMRYPKAGDPNSTVKIGVVDIKSGKTVWMDIGANEDMYVPRIEWFPAGNRLAIQRLNRLQNKNELLIGDAITGKTKVILTETDDKWVEVHDNLFFLSKSDQFLWTSERDGYNHIYLYNLHGKLIRQLTKGQWDVAEINAVDETSRLVYFLASEATPLENHLYAVDLNGQNFKRITKHPGWHRIDFSPNYKHYIDTYSQIDSPPQIGLFANNGDLKRMLVENKQDALNEYRLSRYEFFSFTTSDSVQLNGYILKPPDFDAGTQYPVLMYVYGGPGSQTVQNQWEGRRGLWFQMLAQNGYIVASVDNRGTGARGAAFKKVTYKNLGEWEAHDQIEAAKYLGSLPYVDQSRIGIFGWSYGGFMAALCMFKGNDVFKAGISVAPVTHWKFYDSIYTERYMQTPQLNPEGYRKTAPINFAQNLKGNLLLVHGTADDNVHFQNSVELVNELIKHNKQFETMFYPGRYHGIREGARNTQEHIYTLMTKFLFDEL
jgi:dipeptidyl-peptidase-4